MCMAIFGNKEKKKKSEAVRVAMKKAGKCNCNRQNVEKISRSITVLGITAFFQSDPV